jgi:SAM-dependent methyltransferase
MTTADVARDIDVSRLPAPLDRDRYRLLRRGIYDDAAIDVFVNRDGDFAFLDPLPQTDYSHYRPRAETLGLAAYKKQRAVLDNRLLRLGSRLFDGDSFLEIGAADGAFLRLLRSRRPDRRYCAVEPDDTTRPARRALPWLRHYPTTRDAVDDGCTVSCIGLFHVFEHLVDPLPMLADIGRLLGSNGTLVIEVPCLLDPLLSVFGSTTYENFYFQRQHPFVYTGASLGRVLEAAGFAVVETLAYQRYGLENHLHWLQVGAPGGNAKYRSLFAGIDDNYRCSLEANGKSDTVFVVARAAG